MYVATVEVDVTAIVRAHEEASTPDFVFQLEQSELENDINKMLSGTVRRRLLTESSATVDGMSLDTTVTTEYASEDDTVVGTDQIAASEDAMQEELNAITGADVTLASKGTTVQTTVGIDTTASTQSIDTLAVQNSNTV